MGNRDLVKYYDGEAKNAQREGLIHIHDLSSGIKFRDLGVDLDALESCQIQSPSELFQKIIQLLKAIHKESTGSQTIFWMEKNLIQLFDKPINKDKLRTMYTDFITAIEQSRIKTNIVFPSLGQLSDLAQRVFFSTLKNKLSSYPIPIYALTKEYNWKNERIEEVFKATSDYGFPYFINWIDHPWKKDEYPDPRVLYRISGGPHAYMARTGSIGKISINLPLIAYLSKDEEDFFDRLGDIVYLSGKTLEKKRGLLEDKLRSGVLEFTSKFLENLDWQFSTIGLVGMNEALLMLIEGTTANPAGKAVTYKTLEYIRGRLVDLQLETGHPFNLETSDEQIGNLFAAHNKEKYPEITTSGEEIPYYTHSTQLPVDYTDDLWDALEHQHKIQQFYNGSTGFNIHLDKKLHDYMGCKILIKGILDNFGLPSLTISPVFSICPRDGYLNGETEICPKCGGETQVYVHEGGLIRSLNSMNELHKEVYKQRRHYAVVSKR